MEVGNEDSFVVGPLGQNASWLADTPERERIFSGKLIIKVYAFKTKTAPGPLPPNFGIENKTCTANIRFLMAQSDK